MDSAGYGNLSKISVPRLLHLVYSKNDEAAVLEMVREPARKRFFFKNGVPVAATSNILNEVLGRLLVQKGIISQDDYQRSLEVVLTEKKRHGEVLISMGVISREKLDDFLSLQLRERLLKVFGWTEGEYRYAVVPKLPPNLNEYPHHPSALIIDGIELGFYPDSRAREELRGYLDKRPKLGERPGRYRIEDFGLNLQERRFLDLFDGGRTLRDILDATALLRHRAVSLALSFITMGIVEADGLRDDFEMLGPGTEALQAVEQAGGSSRLNAEFLFSKAKSALAGRDYRGAAEILRKITDMNPLEGEYWAYLGWALYNEDHGRIKEATSLIKDSIDLDNDIDTAWHFLGVLSLDQGDIGWAEKAFRTAHEKNPWHSEALVELKRLEISKGLAPPDDAEARALYTEYFAFSRDPFRLEPAHGPIGLAAEEARCVEGLAREVEGNAGGLLLTAEDGAGKTTTAIELVRRLSASRVLSALILRPENREIGLMRTINSELYAPADANAIREQLISLGSRVSQNAILGGRTLIIIDRADTLTEGCLKLVQYLTRLKTLQIMLIARPDFIERLGSPGFRELDQRLSTRFSLGPFTLEDTRAFILRRIESASKCGTRPIIIKDSALELIHSGNRGLPALINACMAQVLAVAAESRSDTIDTALVERALKRHAGSASAANGDAARSVAETPAAADLPPALPTVEEAGGAAVDSLPQPSMVGGVEAGFDEEDDESLFEHATLFEETEDSAPGSGQRAQGAVVEEPRSEEGGDAPVKEADRVVATPPADTADTAGARVRPVPEPRPAPSANTANTSGRPVDRPAKGAEKAGAGEGLKRLTLIIVLIVLGGLAIGAAMGYYYLVQSGRTDASSKAAPLSTRPAPLPEATPPQSVAPLPEANTPTDGPTGRGAADAGAKPLVEAETPGNNQPEAQTPQTKTAP